MQNTLFHIVLAVAVGFPVTVRAEELDSGDNPQSHDGIRVVKNVPYLGADRDEKLDLYLPAESDDERRPAIVIIHGGGWHGGDKAAGREQNIGRTLARAGYVCASIN